jgi:prepilin-type processing-associated H-X9-DG protein
MDPKVAWMADRGPQAANPASPTEFCTKFSSNHGNDGENALYGDGHVEFVKDTNNIQVATNNHINDNFKYWNASGWAKNNIYTRDYWLDPDGLATADGPVLSKHGTLCQTPVSRSVGDFFTKDSVIFDWMMAP